MMMSTTNDNKVMTLESGTPRPEGVSNATGEERPDGIIPCIDDAAALKPNGRAGADNPKDNDNRCNLWKTTLKIATWNVRTMNSGKLDIVTRELERCDVSLCGVAEMRWTGKGHFTTASQHVVYYSGTEKKREQGVAFVACPEVARCVLGYNPISPRIITIRIQGSPMNLTVIQAYAPTSSSTEEEINTFYELLQQTIDNISKRDILVTIGDFNAKAGGQCTNKNVMGNYGLGEQNERGELLIDFCQENGLMILNTLFKQHPRRLYTWSSPDGSYRNQIDYILVQKRWRSSFTSAKTYPGADCGSDHQLLVSTMKMKLRRIKKPKKPVRFDITKLDDNYRVEVKNKFQKLMEMDSEESTPDELWQDIKQAALETAEETIPKRKNKRKPWLTEKVFALADQRREVKEKGLDSEEGRREYRDLSREIQKQIRSDKSEFIRQRCAEVEKNSASNNTKDMFKNIKLLTSKPSTKLNVVKDKDGNVLTEEDEIKTRWKEYCEELYASKDDDDTQEDREQQEFEDDPDILLCEVENAMKVLRSGKAPGVDNIQAELLKESGEEGVVIIHRLCNKIWKSKEWPDDWKKAVFLPLPKKGDVRECSNNRTISLISHASKVLLHIIAERIRNKLDSELPPEQAGFRRGRGTRNQIGNLRNLMEKTMEFQQPLFLCFIDYTKAFDCVQHQKLWRVMHEMGFSTHLIILIKSLYDGQEATVRTECGDSDWFTIGQGVRQGCILSPYLFNIYAEYIMRIALDGYEGQVSIGGRQITNLRYADDTTLIARTAAELQDLIERVKKTSEEYGLLLNVKKTKVMICGGTNDHRIQADEEDIEVVNTFNFLGSLIVDTGGSSEEIKRRLAMARSSTISLTSIWKDRGISRKTKIRIMNALVFPIATYGSETWALGAADRKKINAFEMWCWRRMLRISWREHKTNEFVNNQIGSRITLCQKIDKIKLQYFGHIARREGDNLEKIITQGHVEGKRKRGRQKTRWSDGIKEITGLNVCTASRYAQDRVGWNVIIDRVTTGQP